MHSKDLGIRGSLPTEQGVPLLCVRDACQQKRKLLADCVFEGVGVRIRRNRRSMGALCLLEAVCLLEAMYSLEAVSSYSKELEFGRSRACVFSGSGRSRKVGS